MRLAVHEENQQSVVVDSVGNVGLEDVEAAGDKLTTLLGWFEANKQDDAIGQLTFFGSPNLRAFPNNWLIM